MFTFFSKTPLRPIYEAPVFEAQPSTQVNMSGEAVGTGFKRRLVRNSSSQHLLAAQGLTHQVKGSARETSPSWYARRKIDAYERSAMQTLERPKKGLPVLLLWSAQIALAARWAKSYLDELCDNEQSYYTAQHSCGSETYADPFRH